MGAIASGSHKKKPSAGNTNTIVQLPVSKVTSDPRWYGLQDCFMSAGLQSGATDKSLDTYGVLTKSGNVIGNIWYRGKDVDHDGPLSYTLQAGQGVPQSDVTAALGCIHDTFGPGWRTNKYVRKYNSPREQLDTKANFDAHWTALRACFKTKGFSYYYASDFPTTVIVHKVGVVDYGSSGPGTLVGGKVKYIVDNNPAPSAGDTAAFISCVTQEY